MAERKRRDLGGHPANYEAEADKRVFTLSEVQYNNVLRAILAGPLSVAQQLRDGLAPELKRLGHKGNWRKAVMDAPAGSDQVDTQSILRWARDIPAGDVDALSQLVAIQATARRRAG